MTYSSTDRALYVGEKPGNRNVLLHRGWVRALESFGWHVDWLSHSEGQNADLSRYDLILWDGNIREPKLRTVHSQALILIGGAGSDLSYYARYADRITLLVSSFDYSDEPFTAFTTTHLRVDKQLVHSLMYERLFRRNASPWYWRQRGIPFMYVPFASDPELFKPRGTEKRWLWGFAGNTRGRPRLNYLMAFSRSKEWPFEVIAPELGKSVDPLELGTLYSQMRFGFNEQHRMTFGRELNQRSFDIGMSGLLQVTDVGHLAKPAFGKYCFCYAGKLAGRMDEPYLATLAEQASERASLYCREEIHEYFRLRHSFQARLQAISNAVGLDLTRGRGGSYIDNISRMLYSSPGVSKQKEAEQKRSA
jgi:hypothetical protein